MRRRNNLSKTECWSGKQAIVFPVHYEYPIGSTLLRHLRGLTITPYNGEMDKKATCLHVSCAHCLIKNLTLLGSLPQLKSYLSKRVNPSGGGRYNEAQNEYSSTVRITGPFYSDIVWYRKKQSKRQVGLRWPLLTPAWVFKLHVSRFVPT